MINAAPYSGKTLLLMAMMIAQDYNLALFNRFSPTFPRTSLFIGGGDAPDWDYGGQARKLMVGYGLDKEKMNLCEIAMLPNEGPKLTDQSFLDWIVQFHNETGFGMLVIDTLLSVHRGEENDARAMGAVMSILKHLRDDLKISVIFGHHDAKNTSEKADVYKGRGSSVIAGSVDFMLSLQSKKQRIKLTSPKHRGGILMESPVVYFDIVEERVDDEVGLKLVPPTSTREGYILSLLSSEPMARKDISKKLASQENISYATAYNAVDTILKNLVAVGRVVQKERGIWGIS